MFNICGSEPEVPDSMFDSFNPLLSKFFANPKCPPAPTITEAVAANVDLIESAKDSEENASVED